MINFSTYYADKAPMKSSAPSWKNRKNFEDSPLRQLYLRLLKKIDQGDFESIADEIHAFRTDPPDPSLEPLRRLIAARIAIFKGEPPENLNWLKFSTPEEPWLEAEALCILGVHRFHMGRDLEGAELFEEARKRFLDLGLFDREVMSAYNSFIGRVNSGTIPDLAKQLTELQELENHFRSRGELEKEHPSILAMILRQKSYLFQADGRLNAALDQILAAAKLYERMGPKSDHHLCLLQSADLYLELGDSRQARAMLEQVVPPYEVRVLFPIAYIEWRLGEPAPNPDNFEYISVFWRKKWNRKEISAHTDQASVPVLTWDLERALVIDPKNQRSWTLKSSSLEGKLIRALQRGKQGKAFLSELLWPEQAWKEQIDNRLHRLVSRANKRFGSLILFDGQHYRLAWEIQIK